MIQRREVCVLELGIGHLDWVGGRGGPVVVWALGSVKVGLPVNCFAVLLFERKILGGPWIGLQSARI